MRIQQNRKDFVRGTFSATSFCKRMFSEVTLTGFRPRRAKHRDVARALGPEQEHLGLVDAVQRIRRSERRELGEPRERGKP